MFLDDLIEVEIEVDEPGAAVTVTILLNGPAPAGYEWYKYSSTSGWSDYSANARFNRFRDEVTLTLVDGGVGDDDGVANGLIVDPSGLGAASAGRGATPLSSGGGGGGGGCFIGTALFDSRVAN